MRNINPYLKHCCIKASILLCLSLVTSVTFAQENLDSLFLEARESATTIETRPEAIKMCKRALALNPEYHDFRILLGRCYSWDGLYAQAIPEFEAVIHADSSYQDARDALLDALIWSNQLDKALDLATLNILIDSTNLDDRYQKARILEDLMRQSEALVVYEEILAIDPGHQKARDAIIRQRRETYDRSTSVRYVYNRLAETKTQWQFIVVEPSLDPWNFISIEHVEPLKIGPLILRLNYASRFKQTASQVEIESYPVIRKGTYLYAGVGLSNSDLFPKFRMGLEVFQALPQAFEASVGFRYLEVPDKQIPIYVGSLGKYWQSYWMNLKTYISPSNSSVSKSWVMSLRKYLKKSPNYLEMFAGTGVSPDTDLSGEDVSYLGSRSFGLALKYQVKPEYDINFGLNFSNIETRADAFRGDTGLQISVTKNY